MGFKDFQSFSSDRHSVQWNGTILCNNVEGIIYGEHSCEVILNLDQWFRRCCYHSI